MAATIQSLYFINFHLDDHDDDYNSRPPLLEGSNYRYWKPAMELHLRWWDAWQVIENAGDPEAVKLMRSKLSRGRNIINEEEKRRLQLNARALHILHCGLRVEESMSLIGCKTAKEMWDRLGTIHRAAPAGRAAPERRVAAVVEHEEFDVARDEYEEEEKEEGARDGA